MPVDIVVFGASGHGKVVLDIIEREGIWRVVALADDAQRLHGTDLYGYRVAGGREWLQTVDPAGRRGLVAIGANAARRTVAEWMRAAGFSFIAARHPAASLARGAAIGEGSVVMAGAVVNSDAQIGRHCIVNTAASVDHDSAVGDFSHVGPGVRLCGGVRVGAGVLLGAGATVIPGRRIGDGAVVGAGAVVVTDVPAGAVVAGVPARAVHEVAGRNEGEQT
ncbi:MAG: acetyltransferase [Burkholderiales bacterium]|nr:acetyltransferase [Burkholderiales bacterium]